jgi:hypothetical protein
MLCFLSFVSAQIRPSFLELSQLVELLESKKKETVLLNFEREYSRRPHSSTAAPICPRTSSIDGAVLEARSTVGQGPISRDSASGGRV